MMKGTKYLSSLSRIKYKEGFHTVDLTGQRFGRLVVVSLQNRRKTGIYEWLCHCDCGNDCIVGKGNLLRGITKSCGCFRSETTAKMFRKNLTGKRFGKLIALKIHGKDRWGKYLWECVCDCGGVCTPSSSHLISGHTQSCGCLIIESISNINKTHGMSDSREYSIWCNMRTRCENKNSTGYSNYGGRGISVCSEWYSFDTFLSDMGLCPEGHTIERIDNSEGYCASNCRWATDIEQANNKRNNIIVNLFGRYMTVAEASRLTGIRYGTLRYRAINNLKLQ